VHELFGLGWGEKSATAAEHLRGVPAIEVGEIVGDDRVRGVRWP